MHVYALFGYAAFAVLFTWPLAPQIGTHLTGSPAGDTGVYIWNQWVFQHEILENGNFPYFTDKIFSLTGRANLSLHNYTAFQDLVALPLRGWLGIVATFNVVYLLMTMLTGYAAYLLARHVDRPQHGIVARRPAVRVEPGAGDTRVADTSASWPPLRWRYSCSCSCGPPSASGCATPLLSVRPCGGRQARTSTTRSTA